MVRSLVLTICLLALSGCETLAVSVLGIGAGTALRHTIDGVTYRTFTAPAPKVREATLAALERMGIRVLSSDKYEGGEVVYADSETRAIELELEPVSPRATRIRVAAKNGGFFYDSATALEIVAQTERLLLDSAAAGR